MLKLTSVLVWTGGTLCWTGLGHCNLSPLLRHHRCLRLLLGSHVRQNLPPVPFASVTTLLAVQYMYNNNIMGPSSHLSGMLPTKNEHNMQKLFVLKAAVLAPCWIQFWRFCCSCHPAASYEMILQWVDTCPQCLLR